MEEHQLLKTIQTENRMVAQAGEEEEEDVRQGEDEAEVARAVVGVVGDDKTMTTGRIRMSTGQKRKIELKRRTNQSKMVSSIRQFWRLDSLLHQPLTCQCIAGMGWIR